MRDSHNRHAATGRGSGPAWIARGAALAAAYCLTGRLALMLAIAPGYATSVWPSAGIAVGCMLLFGLRLWPGVLLGSFLVNIGTSLDTSSVEAMVRGVALAGSISVGASLRAVITVWLVRRYVGLSTALDDEGGAVTFVALIGPIGGTIAATAGATSLLVASAIQPADYAFTWWTWWVGDTIGAIIFTVLVLAVYGRPRQAWIGRRMAIAAPLCLLFAATVFVFVRVSAWERDRIMQDEFGREADAITDRLSAELSTTIEAVHSVASLLETTPDVSRQAFAAFTRRPLHRHEAIQALEWIPRVPHDQREAYESLAREDGLVGFRVSERAGEEGMRPAKSRSEYFPVFYVEPMAGNEAAIGFDLASNPTRRAALNEAERTAEPVATARIRLVQESGDQFGFLVFVPVFRGADGGREGRLIGYALGVFRIGDIVESVLAYEDRADIVVALYDDTAPAGERLLYGRDTNGASAADRSHHAELPTEWAETYAIGHRQWTLRLAPTQEYMLAHRGWQAWGVMAGGLSFTALMGVLLLAVTGRTTRVERVVAERTRELQDSSERLRTVHDTVTDGIITTNDAGIIESCNAAAAAMFRHGGDGVVGLPITRLLRASYHDEYSRHAAQSVGSGAHELGLGELEVEAVRADASGFPMAISTRRMRLDDREMFTSVVRDITERKAADRLKDEFISTVSHELRTPLTAIQGAVGLVVEGAAGEMPADAQKLLAIAYSNGDRLVRLINDILDIQKIESGKVALADERLRVRDVLQQAAEANQAYADQYDVAIQMDDPVDDPWVCADADRLMQVMANLLSNAAKFSPKGGTVVIGATRRDGMARISVTDRGMGIPAGARETVFEKFTQVDTRLTRDRGGTGLGLSICKAIVERMGGSIDYESEVGEGSTFYVDLPEWRPPELPARNDAAVAGASRVLVCEDDPDVAALLARMLEEAGFVVDVAHSAGQAMAALDASAYDAMTLDLLLPDRNGVDFLRHLRETEEGASLAVVIVSAVADVTRQDLNGAALQVMDWIGKPIDERRLIDAVERATQSGSDALPAILHVEDDLDIAQVVHTLLRDVADITHATDLQSGIDALGQRSYELVILDIALPDGSGLDVLSHVGTTPVVIFAAEEADPATDERVAAALVKSRAGNAELLRTIASLIGDAKD